MNKLTRRQTLKLLGTDSCAAISGSMVSADTGGNGVRKNIPGSGESLAVIGMGTWQTFNVGFDPRLKKGRTHVLDAFFTHGGELIDSSPMYGSSASVVGHALKQLGGKPPLFSADKVWTGDGSATAGAVFQQESEWGIDRFDLMQIHNLLAWEEHLEHLLEMKRQNRIRYIGVTTSHGRRHRELENILLNQPVDFVQLTYNIAHQDAEERLLPIAAEKGIAVIANRPYAGGNLIRSLKSSRKLPSWAGEELDCRTWAEFLLKYVVSHPAVTCAIPATSRVDHMQENMMAGKGRLPSAGERQKMLTYFGSL